MRILPTLPLAAVMLVLPTQAQEQLAPDEGPQAYGYQQPTYGRAPSAYYEFDRGLLNAVSGCAYRASRANLSTVVVREVDRVAENRFQIGGRAEWQGYYGPGSKPPLGYQYNSRPYSISFTCTADRLGRVISWSARRP